MITKEKASNLRTIHRHPVWHGEDFASAVVRMDREVTSSATSGSDGISMCFNPAHVPALVAILKEHGFAMAHKNGASEFRVDVQW